MAGTVWFRRAWLVALALVAVVLVQVQVSGASGGDRERELDRFTPRNPVLSSYTGKGPSQVKVLAETGTAATGSTTTDWVDLPGASTNVTIPPKWTSGMILVRFSGRSQCTGTATVCYVRVQIGGQTADPGAVLFDDAVENDIGAALESNAMQAVRAGLGPGTYQVKVQFAEFSSTQSFYLGTWTLTVERIKQI